MDSIINSTTKFHLITCFDCGMPFYVPDNWIELRRRDHKLFTCPNGHQQHFTATTEEWQKVVDRLKKVNKADIALLQPLEALSALTKIICEPDSVTAEELEKLLAIIMDFDKFQKKNDEEKEEPQNKGGN